MHRPSKLCSSFRISADGRLPVQCSCVCFDKQFEELVRIQMQSFRAGWTLVCKNCPRDLLSRRQNEVAPVAIKNLRIKQFYEAVGFNSCTSPIKYLNYRFEYFLSIIFRSRKFQSRRKFVTVCTVL